MTHFDHERIPERVVHARGFGAHGIFQVYVGTAKGLSQLEYIRDTPQGRKVAILAADGVTAGEVTAMREALQGAGVTSEIVALHLGSIQSADGQALAINQSLLTTDSVLYDAVYVPSGAQSITALQGNAAALRFVQDAFKHYKPLAASSEGANLLQTLQFANQPGVVTETGNNLATAFLEALGKHRFWDRQV